MKQMNSYQPKGRRTFDRAFKQSAVNLWLKSNRPAKEVAEELGILEKYLHP